LNACLALEKISFAFATLLLLRFFSVAVAFVFVSVEVLRSGEVRSTKEESWLFVVTVAEGGEIGLVMTLVVVSPSFLVEAGLELPNILFSRPPWPEKLRLFCVASLNGFDGLEKCCEVTALAYVSRCRCQVV
jgi:hypothetical protein